MVGKTAYFAGTPLVGVLVGLWIASFLFDVGLRGIFMNPGALLSLLSISLVISIVLSVIFVWRERGTAADAALALERLRAARIEREATLANLRALQAQIEPHFLFNTLANVTSLIDPEPATAKRMLDSFIRFLRASLASTRMEQTTLADEAELITSFLQVLQVRMGERLRFRIDVAPELAGFTLPPMLLQPVVENAIRHGLEPKVDGGEVAFRARREESAVVIEIADTGVGFAPTTRGGVGLSNLRDRLKLLYGDRASLTIGENAPVGTRVTVRLPA
jgi:LytS/YehU family sensor histidine kinase